MTFRLAESKYRLYFGLSLFLKEVSAILYRNPWQVVPVSETKQSDLSELRPRHKQSNMQYILDSYKKIEKRIYDGFETRIEIENIQLFWNNLLASLPAARLLTYLCYFHKIQVSYSTQKDIILPPYTCTILGQVLGWSVETRVGNVSIFRGSYPRA